MDDSALAHAADFRTPVHFGDDMDTLTRASPADVFDREDIDRDTIDYVLQHDGYKGDDDLLLDARLAPAMVDRGDFERAVVRSSMRDADDLTALARSRKAYQHGAAATADAAGWLGALGSLTGVTAGGDGGATAPNWMAPGYAAAFADMPAADRAAAFDRTILPSVEDAVEGADVLGDIFVENAYDGVAEDPALAAELAEQAKLKAEWEAYQASQAKRRRRRSKKRSSRKRSRRNSKKRPKRRATKGRRST